MKKVIFTAFSFLLVLSATAQYKAVDEGSSVQFKVKNFGFNSGGMFSGLNGTIDFDSEKPSEGKFDVTVQANSVNTSNESRDNHLREETYFGVKNHPQIHFVSTRISASGKAGTYSVTGNLTIKRTTKEISFPFIAEKQGDGLLFKGEFKINRRDFEVGGSSTISDNVDVILKVHARKK